MRRFGTYRLFFLALLVMGLGCSGEKEISEEAAGKARFVNVLFGNDSTTLFRSASIAAGVGRVENGEPHKPSLSSDSLLTYEFSLGEDSLESSVELFYSFDTYGLFEVQADIYPQTDSIAKFISEDIAEYLNDRFGSAKQIGIVKRWTTNSASNTIIEITLSNETADSDEPFVSLNFLEPLDDEL